MEMYPIARELVLAGGGHSHVILLRMLAMQPIAGVHVTLISPDVETPYSGMLPGLIAGHYQRDEVYIDLVPLCRLAGADFIAGSVDALDPDEQTVTVAGRPALRYDVLSVDVGSTPSLGGLEAAKVIPVKPIGGFLSHWRSFLERFAAGDIRDIGFIGAGAGGVELCLAVTHYLECSYPDFSFRSHIVTDGKTILREYPANVRIVFEKLLNEKQITVHRDFRASAAGPGELRSGDGRSLGFDEVFCVTQASAQTWSSQAGISVDDDGFIRVLDSLQSESFDNIFAVGDCSTMVNHPRPKAGVYAVRQGMPLYKNVRRYLLGENVRPFKPQSQFLALITTGPKHAVASRNGLSASGLWIWRWKDWIDRRFMRRFSELPEMPREIPNNLVGEFDDQMHCGGCGSKVSADLLSGVLIELLGDAAPTDDATVIEVPQGRTLLQSTDHFRGFINDPYRQARIAVCHAASDIYACGGAVKGAMAMLTMPFGKPDVTRSLLRQVMAGTIDQLREEGGQLIGGHTAEGIELIVGFSVNGLVDQGSFWRKQGLEAGDCLVLTKPLGTGTILAADMQCRARGEWVEAAIGSMLQSNRSAVDVLREYPVSACTDVTGFGLAGHMREMVGNTGIGIEIDADSLPLLPGAAESIEQTTSTLHEANRRSSPVEDGIDILFDPQTSGGLLAGLPAGQADDCVRALREAGYHTAVVIGYVTDHPGLRLRAGERHV